MAGGEIYRVEIPIIIDDQTDKPLQQAERKVSRFEKSVQKTNERIRRIFGREIRLKISAVDKAWPVIKSVQTRLRSLTGRAWNVTLQVKDRVTGFLGGLINKLTSPLTLLGAGAGIGAGIFYPLKLAGEFEQARMSLDFYMGSVEEGERAFQDLIRFAKDTPFEFPFLQEMTIQLMGTGYNFEQAKRALQAFGDAAGRTGAGMQGIEAALLGFTQIASAGTLNLQDLKQVALNLKLPLNIFAKELGVAEDQLGNIGSAGISSAQAMEAIVRTLEQRFAGGMKELSNSLLGMLAVISDTANLTVWHFGKGMAEPVKRILMDIIGLTEETGGKFEEFQKRLERAGGRVGRKFEEMYRGVKQFFRELTATPGWDEMAWSEKVTVALDKILKSVTAWLKGPGGKAIKKTGEILGSLLAAGLEGALPNIIPIAVTLGTAIAKGILQGFKEMLASSPLGATISGALGGAGLGAAVGSVIPGVGTAVGAGAGAIAGGIAGIGSWVVTRPSKKHQHGGILTSPHIGLVAEAGPEAIIPLSARMRPRALELWQQTGELLGVVPHASGGIFGNVLGGVRDVWDKTKALFKSDRVSLITNTTESAAIALESTRKGQELTTRSIQMMSPVTAMLGAILGGWAGAFGGRAAASALYDRFSPHATGGILTRPHLGLVAEAGPEAIIPLSTRMRARALALYEETGRRLGVRPYAEGGLVGTMTEGWREKIPVSLTPSLAVPGLATVNLNFDLAGLVSQVVIENRDDIDNAIDKITDAIANNLRAVFQNMTK